jgi:hypothetical protein
MRTPTRPYDDALHSHIGLVSFRSVFYINKIQSVFRRKKVHSKYEVYKQSRELRPKV